MFSDRFEIVLLAHIRSSRECSSRVRFIYLSSSCPVCPSPARHCRFVVALVSWLAVGVLSTLGRLSSPVCGIFSGCFRIEVGVFSVCFSTSLRNPPT